MAKKPEGREQALEATLAQLKKRFGDGAIMKLGEAPDMEIEAIPTGSIALDLALGIGGVPRGRITEIYGPESSGKTTLCQHIIAEAQKMGGVAAFIDVEHALDPAYAAKCGVDVANLYIAQPDTGEQALEIAEALVRSGAVDVIVIDSVAALVPRAEIEGDMGDSHVGLQARLMSQALRKLAGAIKKSNTAVIFTNQIRMKIGVLFGNPETTTGGNALKFYASVRMDIRRKEAIKQGGEIIGNRTKVKIKKNKVAPPFREAEFDILYNEGISVEGDVLDVATELDIVTKRGAYYSYGDIRLGQGRENAKQFLRENPEILAEIDSRIRIETGLPPKPGALTPEQLALLDEADEKPKQPKRSKKAASSADDDNLDVVDIDLDEDVVSDLDLD
ncbi:MAG: recombinase RecA [Ardenticatenia bacterium]|nr:MAG: recombinase RecA [Ardenticatenia bacterium]